MLVYMLRFASQQNRDVITHSKAKHYCVPYLRYSIALVSHLDVFVCIYLWPASSCMNKSIYYDFSALVMKRNSKSTFKIQHHLK